MKTSDSYEQTARVRFDNEEERGIVAKYIRPQSFKTNDEVIPVAGQYRGMPVVIREMSEDDTQIVVSTRQNPAAIDTVAKSMVVPLALEVSR